jgi:hypothetical protein
MPRRSFSEREMTSRNARTEPMMKSAEEEGTTASLAAGLFHPDRSVTDFT